MRTQQKISPVGRSVGESLKDSAAFGTDFKAFNAEMLVVLGLMDWCFAASQGTRRS